MPIPRSDVEVANRPKEYLEGFADFSHYIVSDNSLSIYRRFRTLGARNLLYLQAELQQIEEQLHEIDERDRKKSSNPFCRSQSTWLTAKQDLGRVFELGPRETGIKGIK
jgi:hypothetical protein